MSLPQLAPGQAFADRYRLGHPLADTDPPRAFLVHRDEDGATFRLDLFEPEPNPEKRARLLAALHRAALLEGPFVEPLIEVGVLGEAPWMITPTSDEETLAAYLARKGKLSGQEACAIVYQMGGVLAAARARALQPLDIAPEHFLVVRDATGQISPSLRFRAGSLARFLMERDRAPSDVLWPTWTWMAPELMDRNVVLIASTHEAWALGLVAFRALTGHGFWRGSAPMALMREVLVERLPLASERAADVGARGALPPEFDAWFSRCVARVPSERFAEASAAEQSFQDLFAPRPAPIIGNPKGAHYDDGLQGVVGPGGPYRGQREPGPGPGSIHIQSTDVIMGNPKGSYYDKGHLNGDEPSRLKRWGAISILVMAIVSGIVWVVWGMRR